MNETPTLMLACIAGVGLGALFFGGLWWTLRKAIPSQHPALWLASSLLLRIGLTLLGFYFVAAGNWQRMLACLAGFAVSRAALTWLTRPRPGPTQEVNRAAHS